MTSMMVKLRIVAKLMFPVGVAVTLLALVACGPTATVTPTPMPTFTPTRVVMAANTRIPTSAATSTSTATITASPVSVATSTSAPTDTPVSRATPTAPATVTSTPEPVGTPVPTPTLGPQVTRTPAPPGLCPAPSDQVPEQRAISPIDPGVGIIEGFEPQILAYLSVGGSSDNLREALDGLTITDADGTSWQSRVQVVTVDVTGNEVPDVVVSLVFLVEGQYADGGLFVYSCHEGAYEGGAVAVLGGQVFSAVGPDPGIRAIQDMNHDGVPEIVLSYIEAIGTHANFTRFFRILEWDGLQFVDLIQSDFHPFQAAGVNNGDGVVLDTNGNRNLELVLTNGIGQYYEDGGPQRERTDVWAWNGYAFVLRRWQFEPPTYRFQAVQDGDDATRTGEYDEALAFYQQAISDEQLLGWSQGQLWPDSAYGGAPTPTPDPNERSRLSAYAYYRMMLLYALQGSQAEVQGTYETLQAQFAEGDAGQPYAALATAFWRPYSASGDVATACAEAVEYAAAHTDEILRPLGSGFYGYHNRDYGPGDVCPLQ